MATQETANDATFTAIVRADRLEATLDAASVLVDEAKVHCEPTGIEIRAVDPANVGMVDLSLDAEGFESYTGTGRLLGINVGRLLEFLSMADSDDLVELEFDAETRKLHLTIGELEGTLALIDPDAIRQEPDIPDLDLPVEAVIEGRDFSRGVKAADMVSDHVELGALATYDLVTVDAQGDTDDVHLELDSEEYIALDATEDARSLFSLEYFKDIETPVPKDAEVTLELGTEFPVKMHFTLADGHASVTYLVAPRIQGD